jgi:long-subunit acyl-CoA synthetase (AMP-forming)
MNEVLINRLRMLSKLGPMSAVALSDGVQNMSYTELLAAVLETVAWLKQADVRVVALQADNSIAWVFMDLACQVANCIFIPLPDFFSEQQRLHAIQSAGVDLLLVDASSNDVDKLNAKLAASGIQSSPVDLPPMMPWLALRLQGVADYRESCPAATQKITFTSGSTGTPKGVCLSSEHQWRTAEALLDTLQLKNPCHLCLLPLATLLENIAGVYAPLLAGGTVILSDAGTRGFSGSSGLHLPSLLTHIETTQPTSMILFPQLLAALVAACETGWQPPSSIQYIAVGGGKVAPALLMTARAFGLPVYEGYGLSECGSVVAVNVPGSEHLGSVGKPLTHCHITIENNEILVSGSSFLGYLGDSASWQQTQIRTGDLGDLDDAGYLHVQGRCKNILISSYGRNISPEWVESALCAQPLLSRCLVFGDDRPYLGALISAAKNVRDDVLENWIATVNSGLPDYARVRVWQRLDESAWQNLLTANGRLRRQDIGSQWASLIEILYQTTQSAANVIQRYL